MRPPEPWVIAVDGGEAALAALAKHMEIGRATTLGAAILGHGGEAHFSAAVCDQLRLADKTDLIAFLKTLRNPKNPNRDLVRHSQSKDN